MSCTYKCSKNPSEGAELLDYFITQCQYYNGKMKLLLAVDGTNLIQGKIVNVESPSSFNN